jgi:hypothetical protein
MTANIHGLAERAGEADPAGAETVFWVTFRSDLPNLGMAAQRHIRAGWIQARRQTLCDTDRNGAGTGDSLTRDHRSATAHFL